MKDRYARAKPRGTCPHALCGRGDKSCRKLAAGNACLKTHFATHKEWQNFMLARFKDLYRFSDALGKLTKEEEWTIEVLSEALHQRIDERRIDERQAEAAIPERRPE